MFLPVAVAEATRPAQIPVQRQPASNLALASTAKRHGMRFEAYGALLDGDGRRIYPQSEREVFERLGVPYSEPAAR